MKTLFSLFIILVTYSVQAQDFSFELYFEDATGARDTVIIGYDSLATDSIDPAFGEVNLLGQAWSNDFEVRATSFDFWNSGIVPYNYDDYSYYSGICIQENDCSNIANNMLAVLHLKNMVYPITATWDSTLFNTPCHIDFALTDWQPEAWPDFVTGDIEFYELYDVSSGIFDSVIVGNITSTGDTTDLLYIGAASGGIGSNVQEVNQYTTTLYPNPVQDILFLETNQLETIEQLVIYNTQGQQIKRSDWTQDGIDVSEIPTGIYWLQIMRRNGVIENQVFQKIGN